MKIVIRDFLFDSILWLHDALDFVSQDATVYDFRTLKSRYPASEWHPFPFGKVNFESIPNQHLNDEWDQIECCK